MTGTTRTATFILMLVSVLLLAGTVFVMAQDTTPAPVATCAPELEQFFVNASAACIGQPDGYFCNGGAAPQAEPAGPVANSLAPTGELVETGVVQSIQTGAISDSGNTGGLVWMRVADTGVSALMIGSVSVRDMRPEGFPFWTSMVVVTDETVPSCSRIVPASYVLQNSVPGQEVRVAINGASLALRGTVVVQTVGATDETIFITIEGQARVIALGWTEGMVAGQQVRVRHAPDDFTTAADVPSAPLPFEPGRVRYLPTPLLDRAPLMPQPGFVATEGTVNLRTEPSIYAALLFSVPPGTFLSVLGQNPAADWYHVRLPTGETGWMFAELLERNHGAIETVYENTPAPPQRFGPIGTQARVSAPNGTNVREQPYVIYGVLGSFAAGQELTLVARSPYSPWVKVDGSGLVGWVPLLDLETQAIISALPLDLSVALPPEPTQVPGSWGNAFPDPNCYPSCGP